MLRGLKRNIARNRMRKAGMEHINKPRVLGGERAKSKFAELWKSYVR